MKLLGIDYGKRKIGLAISESYIATPYVVLKVKSDIDAVEKIKDILVKEDISQIVFGLPDGEIALRVKKFGKLLQDVLDVPIIYYDETLSTKMAQFMSLEAGINRKKRKEMEDAYAATVILQSFLDDHYPFD